MKDKRISYSKIIAIMTVLFLSFFVYKYVASFLRQKEADKFYSSYSGCSYSISKIETALNNYKLKNKGSYPSSLSKLIPNYLKKIPECPSARKDTYSKSYVVSTFPSGYFFCCSGKNHVGPRNTPQRVSELAFYDKKRWNPETYVYENGRMGEVLKQVETINKHIYKGKYREALQEVDALLKNQVAWREHFYMLKAFCHLKLYENKPALEAMNNALAINFIVKDWNRVFPMIDTSYYKAELEKSLLDYISSNEDIDSILFTLKLCGNAMEEKNLRLICEKALNLSLEKDESVIPEFYFRGKLALLNGDKKGALSFFTAIRNFPSVGDTTEGIINALAEKDIKLLQDSGVKLI